MPPPRIQSVLDGFRQEVDRSNALLDDIRVRGVPFFRLRQIAELSYLRIYLAWENFLEESFARFLCGASTLSGHRPTCYAKPKNIEHAKDFLVGLDRPYLQYADWASVENVKQRARLCFRGGAPFVPPLDAALRDLLDMRIIRNHIAHRSSSARKKFRNLQQRHLGVRKNYSAGQFLLLAHAQTGVRYIRFFSSTVTLVAQRIAR